MRKHPDRAQSLWQPKLHSLWSAIGESILWEQRAKFMQQGEEGGGNKVKQPENANLGIIVWPESREFGQAALEEVKIMTSETYQSKGSKLGRNTRN